MKRKMGFLFVVLSLAAPLFGCAKTEKPAQTTPPAAGGSEDGGAAKEGGGGGGAQQPEGGETK